MSLPSTINYPKTFMDSAAAGFDGVFDWSWTEGCFNTSITPMDFDGVVERKGNFLLFETKDAKKPIPKGQIITLEAAHALGCFTIMIIRGKERPEFGEIWMPGRAVSKALKFSGEEEARGYVKRWFKYADENPKSKKVSHEFLQRRVSTLESERDDLLRKVRGIECQLRGILEEIEEFKGQ